ncbi:PASTA domain-containing protein [Streptomyces griseoaurantiacus]|uniref:PASTA domain-containing protein n=1 Tax=Streptomyces griseoaurantiacus TaxID=68213 RepID=UPI0036878F89
MKITSRSRYLFPVVALAATAALAACDADEEAPAKPPVQSTAPATPSSAKPQQSSPAPADSLEKEREDAREKAREEASQEADSSEVPDVVGMNHADAMATLHEAGFMVNEEDASGQKRWIILNSGWKVCSQDPGPGSHPGTLRVEIDSVKLDESC